jgi:hypothetical protein
MVALHEKGKPRQYVIKTKGESFMRTFLKPAIIKEI